MHNITRELLFKKGINEYKLVLNIIKKLEVSFVYNELLCIETDIVHNLLFLKIGNTYYKLIIPDYTQEVLEAIIDKLPEHFGLFETDHKKILAESNDTNAGSLPMHSIIDTSDILQLVKNIAEKKQIQSLHLLYANHSSNRIGPKYQTHQNHHEIQYKMGYTNSNGVFSFKEGQAYDLNKLTQNLFQEDDLNAKATMAADTKEDTLLTGIVYFPTEIMIPVYNALMMALSGELISGEFSMIKREQFNSPVIAPCITITDNPKIENAPIFDAEGSKVIPKTLINKGILVQALNNLKSATALGQTPGNCYINYSTFSYEIKHTLVDIDVADAASASYDILIEHYDTGLLQFDIQTGALTCNLIGYDAVNNQRKKYILNTSVMQLLSRVIGGVGNPISSHNIFTRDILLDFGRD